MCSVFSIFYVLPLFSCVSKHQSPQNGTQDWLNHWLEPLLVFDPHLNALLLRADRCTQHADTSCHSQTAINAGLVLERVKGCVLELGADD